MSIAVEMNGKAGRVCHLAQSGQLHCPLIVRTTSEDVLTGEVIGHLKHLRPHLWLGPLLNLGLGTRRFQQVWYKKLSIRLWERQARYPPELLGFKEGRTEPDIVIEWENPPTTVWIEAKYRSGLAEGTSNARENDQVLRGIRTLLVSTGHVQPNRLFAVSKRQAFWLALLSYRPEPLVDKHRDMKYLLRAISDRDAVKSLPEEPFVGSLTWNDIESVLQDKLEGMTRIEQSVAESLIAYLDHKFMRC